MSDFMELENALKTLRPVRPTTGLIVRIEMALADAGKVRDDVIMPHRFRVNWIGVTVGFAVAAALLLLARIDFHPKAKSAIASSKPSVARNAAELPSYRATALTQVVYDRRDEGLMFPIGAQTPVRRVRTSSRETWQWQELKTGAHLQVSYPAEEVAFIPVSGQ